MHEITTILLVTLPNIHRFNKNSLTISNKPFSIWLLTTSPHLKYVATLPCNLSLMACFADINVSQGCVATCKVGWDFYYAFYCKFTSKKFDCKFTKESSNEKFL